jgi:hypothetical protein
MQDLSRVETMERAREVLLGMSREQEITAELDGWEMSLGKHNDQEYSASFPEQETGVISLLDACHILMEYGDYDLRIG